MEAEEQGLLGLSSGWEPAGWREQFSASWAQRNGQGERTDQLGLGFGLCFPTALTPAWHSSPCTPGATGLLRGAALGSVSGAAQLQEPQDSTFRSDSRSQRAGRAAPSASGRSSEEGGQMLWAGGVGERCEYHTSFPMMWLPGLGGFSLPEAFARGSSGPASRPSAY